MTEYRNFSDYETALKRALTAAHEAGNICACCPTHKAQGNKKAALNEFADLLASVPEGLAVVVTIKVMGGGYKSFPLYRGEFDVFYGVISAGNRAFTAADVIALCFVSHRVSVVDVIG